MADLSAITLPNGDTYNLKDATARQEPIETKTYTNVIATANDQNGAGFFYLRVRGNTYNGIWHIKTKVHAYVESSALYDTTCYFDLWGSSNTYQNFASMNIIRSTSYRPIYYNCHFRVSETGYNNGCGSWVGFSLYNSTNQTSASYKRTVVVDLISYEGCTVEFQDSLITPTNIPNRSAHTGWYSSTDTSYDNFDAYSYGYKFTGDANTTTINSLMAGSGNYVVQSAVYRYQLLFQVNENTLTPLNNVSNDTGTSKTMNGAEFDPFGRIYYYNTTTTVSANSAIAAGNLGYAYPFDLRYTFNCGTTLTAHKPVYLKLERSANYATNHLYKIVTTNPLVHTLPTSYDGYYYLFLGRTYSTYQMQLHPVHPMYYFPNGGSEILKFDHCEVDTAPTTGSNHLITSGAVKSAIPVASTTTPANLGTAAIGTSTAYARADHVHASPSADIITSGYLNIHPENSPVLIPFIHNDIAYLLKRGGSAIVKYDGVEQNISNLGINNVFDGSGSYWSINNTSITTIIIELTLHKTFSYGNWIYIDFGAKVYRAKNVKVDVMNSEYTGDDWTEKFSTTTNSIGHCSFAVSHTPVGASGSGGGFNKIRFTLTDFNTSSSSGFRISQIGVYNYASKGLRETYLPKDGGELYGTISPYSNNGADLGTSSKYWNNAYITKINGATVGSSPKFTDTTYESKAAASGGTAVSLVTTGEKYVWNNKQDALTFDSTPTAGSSNPVTSAGIKSAIPVASSSAPSALGTAAVGTSTNYARADHVHESELFIATYGTTTLAELNAAYDAGKRIVCKKDFIYAELTSYTNILNKKLYKFEYTLTSDTSVGCCSIENNDGTWSETTVTLPAESGAGTPNGTATKLVTTGQIYEWDNKISAPSSASSGQFLVYNGSAWVAQSLATWQSSSY